MAEQLEVIFVDQAGASTTPRQSPSAPDDSGNSSPSRTPGPADRVVGPKKPDSQGIGRDLENAAQRIANALGIGGLTGTALELRKAFSRLYESVTSAEKAVESKRRADSGNGSTGVSGEVKGPVKPVPKPGDIEAPPVIRKPLNPSVPNVGTFERQAAKGDIAGPAVSQAVRGPTPNIGWFERMTAARGGAAAPPVSGSGIPPAVPGVPVAPPVVGPMAGAGTAASGMARLAAAAGPAALAVAGIAGAIAAGVVVIKKTFAAIDKETERLSGYSGALAGAQARAEIRQLGADMRRAQRIGPQLARARDFTSSVETKIADLKTSMLKFGLDVSEGIGGIPKALGDANSKIEDAFKILVAEATGTKEEAKEVRKQLEKMRAEAERARKKAEEKDALMNFGDDFMDAFLGQFTGGMSSQDRRRAARDAAMVRK